MIFNWTFKDWDTLLRQYLSQSLHKTTFSETKKVKRNKCCQVLCTFVRLNDSTRLNHFIYSFNHFIFQVMISPAKQIFFLMELNPVIYNWEEKKKSFMGKNIFLKHHQGAYYERWFMSCNYFDMRELKLVCERYCMEMLI